MHAHGARRTRKRRRVEVILAAVARGCCLRWLLANSVGLPSYNIVALQPLLLMMVDREGRGRDGDNEDHGGAWKEI